MTATAVRPEQDSPAPRPRGRGLRAALLALIAVALVALGGGLAVGLGIGQAPRPTADSVDAGFSRDMAVHHRQGVEMANLALERSTDPEVRRLAFDISSTQTNQAGQMEGWLSLWGLPRSGGEHMAWMGGGHTGHDTSSMDGALMPGMATEAELADLRSLSGTAFDVEFLRLMIRHHQGGFDMAQYAAQHAAEPAVRTLARSIADTQTAEVTTMVDMLTARGGTPLPAP
ncbi:Uncharacterized conserved protein, DUF305 family [Geodermatophilus saharensis]|uniref:Uncharacterized conserved protein, DUF305 family n=1 Tax=Geodermatophilus saharensis TaxID=1137994 RepID=A0A239AA84_9ACTN|nr:DUF305 domain-containing protein [Geodermatophilus saharensis]SNR91793.1 Uncharacterized conserved protein, DUF305 family [Geodermatophilus saharensis]